MFIHPSRSVLYDSKHYDMCKQLVCEMKTNLGTKYIYLDTHMVYHG